MTKFAVIDTETTWSNEVMSIGIVISDDESFSVLEKKYWIIEPTCEEGGMFSSTLMLKGTKPKRCTREKAISDIRQLLNKHGTVTLCAYNASFDRNHLPEMHDMEWLDIIKVAAYKQHNKYLPKRAEYCGTGRLRSGYGVEEMMHHITKTWNYSEKHNAVTDAEDELKIMELLGRDIQYYRAAQAVQRGC